MNERHDLDRIVRMPELEVITGLSRATIYRKIREGTFPTAVELSANSRGWFASQVRSWQESLKPAGAVALDTSEVWPGCLDKGRSQRERERSAPTVPDRSRRTDNPEAGDR